MILYLEKFEGNITEFNLFVKYGIYKDQNILHKTGTILNLKELILRIIDNPEYLRIINSQLFKIFEKKDFVYLI